MATIQISHQWADGVETRVVVQQKVTTAEAMSSLRIDALRLWESALEALDLDALVDDEVDGDE